MKASDRERWWIGKKRKRRDKQLELSHSPFGSGELAKRVEDVFEDRDSVGLVTRKKLFVMSIRLINESFDRSIDVSVGQEDQSDQEERKQTERAICIERS